MWVGLTAAAAVGAVSAAETRALIAKGKWGSVQAIPKKLPLKALPALRLRVPTRSTFGWSPGPGGLRVRVRGSLRSQRIPPFSLSAPCALRFQVPLPGHPPGAPRASPPAHSLPTCLPEFPQGLGQARGLGGRLLRRARAAPLAPRPIRAIPGGLQAPQGHGRRGITAPGTGGRLGSAGCGTRVPARSPGSSRSKSRSWSRLEGLRLPRPGIPQGRRRSHPQLACKEVGIGGLVCGCIGTE